MIQYQCVNFLMFSIAVALFLMVNRSVSIPTDIDNVKPLIDSSLNNTLYDGENSNENIDNKDDLNVNENNLDKNKNKDQNDDVDYFYDQHLTQEEIEKRKKEAEEAEMMRKQQEKEKKKNEEQEPEWFQKAKENKDDPFADFMKKQVEEYLKNYRKEQIDKLKSKTKSDLNHQLLSIIFLSAFFAAGTFIGLFIVFLRGHGQRLLKLTSSKSKNNKNVSKNTIYKQVATTTDNNNNINNEQQLNV